jgi:DNA-binding response OmpR family regulator
MTEITKKILLIEDDSAIADIYQTVLKKAQFDVETIALGQEAIKKMKDIASGKEEVVKPDVVLLDLVLPDINGMEVLSEIRKHDETKNIKVFILSNQEVVDNKESGSVRPDKSIIKANITPSQLAEIIAQELAKS